MNKLLFRIKSLKKEIGSIVKKRINEFRTNRNLFSELCFCILTANYTADGGIRIQKDVKDFSKLNEKEIEKKLRKNGHRFPKTRAKYINLAKKHKNKLSGLKYLKDSDERRKWLVENVKGLGYKESSHFLRNTGYLDVAIIDRHILSVLSEYRLIKMPKTITKKKYMEIENVLKKIAKKSKLLLGELDLYLWYMKTGKILK